MAGLQTAFTRHAGIEYPIICGPMYPCSNSALVAAASDAGGIGVVQPIALTFVEGHKSLRDGLRAIRARTAKPIGFNALIEASSQRYLERMRAWVDVALEEGVRFFLTSLGNPRWVVDKVHAAGGFVYHDVTERKWALKALDGGVDGLVAVNNRAGGHAGSRTPQELFDELRELKVPLVCAGGIGDPAGFRAALDIGYAGVQMGTRFIATPECSAHPDYKQAILAAGEDDIVLTEKLTGVPVSIIRTPTVERIGTKAGPVAKLLLKGSRTKHWMRAYYTLTSAWALKNASIKGMNYKDFWQAGKSVDGIQAVEPTGEIIRRFAAAAHSRAAS